MIYRRSIIDPNCEGVAKKLSLLPPLEVQNWNGHSRLKFCEKSYLLEIWSDSKQFFAKFAYVEFGKNDPDLYPGVKESMIYPINNKKNYYVVEFHIWLNGYSNVQHLIQIYVIAILIKKIYSFTSPKKKKITLVHSSYCLSKWGNFDLNKILRDTYCKC